MTRAASDETRCTNINRQGHRCRNRRTQWGTAEDGWPQPDPTRCGLHMTAEEKEQRELGFALDFARMFPGSVMPLEPACWSWPVPAETVAMLQQWRDTSWRDLGLLEHAALFTKAMRLYDQGRCAICGRSGNEVEDHDHETGLVRGWLCRSCNTREGMNGHPDTVFGRYRERYPYLILGVIEPYTGRGWENGVPLDGREWPPQKRDPWRDNALRGVL